MKALPVMSACLQKNPQCITMPISNHPKIIKQEIIRLPVPTMHNVLLGKIFHKMAHYAGSAIACPTAWNVNYFPQQNIVQ